MLTFMFIYNNQVILGWFKAYIFLKHKEALNKLFIYFIY